MSELNMWVKDDNQQIVLDSEGRVVAMKWKDKSGNGNDLIQNSPEHRPLFRSKREMELEKKNVELEQRLLDAPRIAAEEIVKRWMGESLSVEKIENIIRNAIAGKEGK